MARGPSNRSGMLLRNRAASIIAAPTPPAAGFEHLDPAAIDVLRWLSAARVDFVLVGPVARMVRGARDTEGPVSIVPAPYGRNLDRLAGALTAAHARIRTLHVPGEPRAATGSPLRLRGEQLMRAERWELRIAEHDLDIEGSPVGAPRYQELLYEASRTQLAANLSVEVAAPEDIEHYDHVRRTGSAPELRVRRAVPAPR
jgi:hypothetical protein